jgi:hypothetical protein
MDVSRFMSISDDKCLRTRVSMQGIASTASSHVLGRVETRVPKCVAPTYTWVYSRASRCKGHNVIEFMDLGAFAYASGCGDHEVVLYYYLHEG